MGVEAQTADYAVTYLRIVSIGIPSFFLALGGQGYLRGISELTAPLVVIVLANLVNVVLEVLFVYGFDWGIEGSAWGTAIAQTCMGVAFVWLIARRVGRDDIAPVIALARRLLSVGKFIFVRTAALICAFLLAGRGRRPASATPSSARTRSRSSSGSSSRSCSTRSRSRARSSSAGSSAAAGPSAPTTRACG